MILIEEGGGSFPSSYTKYQNLTLARGLQSEYNKQEVKGTRVALCADVTGGSNSLAYGPGVRGLGS